MSDPQERSEDTEDTQKVFVYDPTGPMGAVDLQEDRLRGWIRIFTFMAFCTLLVMNLFLFSLYQGHEAQMDNQNRRIERLNGNVQDLLKSNQNAEKIEKIKQTIDGIDSHVQELVTVLNEETKG